MLLQKVRPKNLNHLDKTFKDWQSENANKSLDSNVANLTFVRYDIPHFFQIIRQCPQCPRFRFFPMRKRGKIF